MRFYRYVTVELTDIIGEYLPVSETLSSYVGRADLACGASQQQKELETAQAAFFNEQTQEYSTVYNEAQGVLKSLTAEFTPILQAGPNQQGFSQAQLDNLNSTAATGSGQAYHSVEQSLAQQEAAQGGGNDYLPSGAKVQLQEELGASEAQNLGNEQSQIQQANYAQGNQNFQFASSVLGNTAAQLNPNGYSNAATNSGNAAASTANQITQANNSWMGLVGGALGAAATAYAGR
jgi:hypothetical protein